MNAKYFGNIIVCFLVNFIAASPIFAKETSVPFFNQIIQDRLIIHYDLHANEGHLQRIICVFNHFYKGFLFYTENNTEVDSGLSFGDGNSNAEFYFTNKEATPKNQNDHKSLYQFHVDAIGYLAVEDTSGRSESSTASCVYIPEIY